MPQSRNLRRDREQANAFGPDTPTDQPREKGAEQGESQHDPGRPRQPERLVVQCPRHQLALDDTLKRLDDPGWQLPPALAAATAS